jgi:outer membrane protein OmpA-like peptidoglycan-associated protein
MKPRAVFIQAACAAMLAGVGGNALSLPGPRMIGHYDFDYAIRGDRAARPVQVFDDGAGKIFFEVRPGQPMPAVFAGRALELLLLQVEGQFFTARTGESEFTLVLGAARATVARGDAALGGEANPDASSAAEERSAAATEGRRVASAAPGLPSGVRFDVPSSNHVQGVPMEPGAASSYAVPIRGDTLAWKAPGVAHAQPVLFGTGSAALGVEVRGALRALAVRIGREASVLVEGRGDASRKDGLAQARAAALREVLIGGGLAPENIRTRAGAEVDETAGSAAGRSRVAGAVIRWSSPAPTRQVADADGPAPVAFDLRPSDIDIASALRRWARAAGYEVVWDLEWTAPITGRARLEATSFTAAVQEIVTGLHAQGYPVRAQAYADRVIRFSAPE